MKHGRPKRPVIQEVEKPSTAGPGRPRKPINWEIVEKRMEAGCNATEIAGSLQLDLGTFCDRFKDHFGDIFSNYSQMYYKAGDSNLRLTQYMKALSGNTNMMVLLGKERLGQGKEEVKVSPYQGSIDLEHENMALKAQLEFLKEQLKAQALGTTDADQSQAG